jgi:hypothetical protein
MSPPERARQARDVVCSALASRRATRGPQLPKNNEQAGSCSSGWIAVEGMSARIATR